MDNGSRLRQRRVALGKTMREIADAIGVSEATVSRWESGNIANIRGDRISKYAAALDVPPAYITGELTELPVASRVDLSDKEEDIRIVARKMDKMSPKDRKKLMAIIDAMYEDDDDDIE